MVSTTTVFKNVPCARSCDLLKNIYLCGINNNVSARYQRHWRVVICLKISTFVLSTTTFKFSRTHVLCCDLLKNIYLGGINNNGRKRLVHVQWVVICLKISTFVVSTTTGKHSHSLCVSCDLLKNIYLCGINNNAN